ncbi:MAG: hypothetical protein DME65_01515 [Verrucomicrobia bacterium]|nr:MAG: hypothetical protein DME65_01515 [Verrucomicrobiota bacterium]
MLSKKAGSCLTAGVTRVTNRDLAQFTVAVSDNTVANVLYHRVGKDHVSTTLRLIQVDAAPKDDGYRGCSTRRREHCNATGNGSDVGSYLQGEGAEQASDRRIDRTAFHTETELYSDLLAR